MQNLVISLLFNILSKRDIGLKGSRHDPRHLSHVSQRALHTHLSYLGWKFFKKAQQERCLLRKIPFENIFCSLYTYEQQVRNVYIKEYGVQLGYKPFQNQLALLQPGVLPEIKSEIHIK